jgi:YD repeat-containing protein
MRWAGQSRQLKPRWIRVLRPVVCLRRRIQPHEPNHARTRHRRKVRDRRRHLERHTYDEANRITDEKVAYEPYGNITKLSANDAGGHELTSTYYVDGQVAGQEQNKQLIGYKYDPAGRTTETTSENTETKAKTTVVSHYAGTGGALTWTTEGTEKWTRNIPGIDGSLSAIQESSGGTALELHDLQGGIRKHHSGGDPCGRTVLRGDGGFALPVFD